MKMLSRSTVFGVAVAGAIASAAFFTSCEKQSTESPVTDPSDKTEKVEKAKESSQSEKKKTAPKSEGKPATEGASEPRGKAKESPQPNEKKSEPKSEGKPVADVSSEEARKKAEKTPMKESNKKPEAGSNIEITTLAGGCFWCTEAVLEKIEGVEDVVSGYMGGHVENPTYEQICTKTTGHAEVIQVTFDTTKITFEEILDIFWQAHDPTTLNQQGNDRGPQYRSAIFYHTPEQKNIAEQSKAKLDASGAYDDPAVTEITKADKFWVAEDYHQNYYELNKDKNPYCRIVITPKMKKFGFE